MKRAVETYQELFEKVTAFPDAILGHAVLLSDLNDELASLYRRIGRSDRAEPLETFRVKALACLG